MQKLSRYVIASPVFAEGEENRHVLFSTRTGQIFEVPQAIWTVLREGGFDKLNSDVLTQLSEAEILVPEAEAELSTILDRNRDGIRVNPHLNYVIQPTAHCQLGCGYCGQIHERTNLSRANEADILRDVEARLDRGPFAELNLCWFGAEPLSGIQQMRSLTPQLRSLCQERGVEYRASIITNGLAMSRKIGADLVGPLGVVSVTVSLDGTAPHHDRRRHTKSGKPTFDRILANLVQLVATTQDAPIEIKVRCNVDRENASDVVPLLRRLRDEGLERAVQFYTAPIHSWGNDAQRRSLEPADYAERELSWFVEMKRMGFSVPLVPKRQPVVCLAVQPDAALVDAHGTLFNCTEVSYVPSYGTPNRFAIGDLTTGERQADVRDILGSFNDQVEAGAFGCSRCPLLPVCGGACPKEWIEGRAPCPSSKRNIAQRLLLAAAFERMDRAAGDPSLPAVA